MRCSARLGLLALALLGAGLATAQALPSGGNITAGSGQIRQDGQQLTIDQTSPRMVAEWESFSIGAAQKVQFNQPSASSVALNRVTGQLPSSIEGTLNAKGQVFLLNPNGILFGKSAQVSVGALVASTLDLRNDDFMAGHYAFLGNSIGAVTNQGNITATGGDGKAGSIALIAARIVNDGKLIAPGGSVLLGAGQQVMLDLGGPAPLQIEQAALDAQIANGGAIVAEGGQVLLSTHAAQQLGSAVINQSGLIEASSLQGQGGGIHLRAGGGVIVQTGRLHADGATSGGSVSAQAQAIIDAGQWSATGRSAKGGDIQLAAERSLEQTTAAKIDASGHSGGLIDLASGHASYLSGSSEAQGRDGKGGSIVAAAQHLSLAGATFKADGDSEGGHIRVGRGWGGIRAERYPEALRLKLNTSSRLSANALKRGDGGKISVWSRLSSELAGEIDARGGPQGGDGGRVRVGSLTTVAYGPKADVTPPSGGNPAQVEYQAKHRSAYDSNDFSRDIKSRGLELANGHIAVASPDDSAVADKAGAVWLYRSDGALVSALRGSRMEDRVGGGGVTALARDQGDYVIASSQWEQNTGAVTWGSGSEGVTGMVGSANSLVGSAIDDRLGSGGVSALAGGSYVVASPHWAHGAAAEAGAVTWGEGSIGIKGTVTSGNSLIGSRAGDRVGSGGVSALANGNYVVASPEWAHGTAVKAGAVTLGSGTAGIQGVVSSANSLVGNQAHDQVGGAGVKPRPPITVFDRFSSMYVVSSPQWQGLKGAVTWRSGLEATQGEVSSANSLVGSRTHDQVGSGGVTFLEMHSFVVSSPEWGGLRGAVSLGSNDTGVRGVVSSVNSLVGSQAHDRVGSKGVEPVGLGRYAVISPQWQSGRGAVTWGDGHREKGVTGEVTDANSLVGSQTGDRIGSGGVTVLPYNEYAVVSPQWSGNRGAVTWCNGDTASVQGAVTSVNSLVGSQDGDQVGSGGVTALHLHGYVVSSPKWQDKRGAVTWGNSGEGVKGNVSYANSLVGHGINDRVGSGGVSALRSGTYVVRSPDWQANKGAVTWGKSGGVQGHVSSGNSLVGTQDNDWVGHDGVTVLSDGNYVVMSPAWANGTAEKAGAATWGHGGMGVKGEVSSANSLVGSQANDMVGSAGVTVLSDGNYLVKSPVWANGMAVKAGAVTWGRGAQGVKGEVSSANSLVGSHAHGMVGSAGVTVLSDGNYVVKSPLWADGMAVKAGAATWGRGAQGIQGAVSSANSLVGSQAHDRVGSGGVAAQGQGGYAVLSPSWRNGAGAVTLSRGTCALTGAVSSANSAVGSRAFEGVGTQGVATAQSLPPPLPTQGIIRRGKGAIVQGDKLLTIEQTSERMVVDWDSFNIAGGHRVQFNQTSASDVALNRVTGQLPSSIKGTLNAKGQVFLLNPNGILFGTFAQVSVGALLASTLRLGEEDFLAGRYVLGDNSIGAVTNQGYITATGGDGKAGSIALIAARIVNDGRLIAPGGSVLLGAGQQVRLDLGRPARLLIYQAALDAQIANGGLIAAGGGQVVLNTRAAQPSGAALINQSGTIHASNLQGQGGGVHLRARGGVIVQTGRLHADGATSGGSVSAQARAIIDAGQWSATGRSAKGGSIQLAAERSLEQTYAATIDVSGHTEAPIDASGVSGGLIALSSGHTGYLSGGSQARGLGGKGGAVLATAPHLSLAGATLRADGNSEGGHIGVGNSVEGDHSGRYRDALRIKLNTSSRLSANALKRGDGGKISVWSRLSSEVGGEIDARGGPQGGDGGRVTVGSLTTAAYGANADVISPNGGNPAQVEYQAKHRSAYNRNDFSRDIKSRGLELANGHFVVASPDDSAVADKAGAVWLYRSDGALVSSLRGSRMEDRVGGGGVTALDNARFGETTVTSRARDNGDFVIASSQWEQNTGAVTWGSRSYGVTGIVSSANSLVGSAIDDRLGSGGVSALAGGSYVVASPHWANGAAAGAGAVTWVNGIVGIEGKVTSGNSLIGSRAGDRVGSGGVSALANGNYVVASPEWANGTAVEAGAVTLGSGTAGIQGVVSSANSLVGNQAHDQVGSGGVSASKSEHSFGTYVVSSPQWQGLKGAVTWRSGLEATQGEVSSANSLVGSRTHDQVGSGGVTFLKASLVVRSPEWGGLRGAVSWGSSKTGMRGEVSGINSLVGSEKHDRVGSKGVVPVGADNYVVVSPEWQSRRGAVSWGKGGQGIKGTIRSANSLFGSERGDQIGSAGVTLLGDGNYVVASPQWSGNRGAVTWSKGGGGTTGVVGSDNSLVGSQRGDQVGSGGVTAMRAYGYVVSSPEWRVKRGAVTWGGLGSRRGVKGELSGVNSLVGHGINDRVGSGGVTVLTNSSYAVLSPAWQGYRGAVTGGGAFKEVHGTIDASNSLVGMQYQDRVGGGGVTELYDGSYVVMSPAWANGMAVKAGAATWWSPAMSGFNGTVTSANSLVGSQAHDQVGSAGVTRLGLDGYVVLSPFWSNGTLYRAGAVTRNYPPDIVTGAVSSANSRVGTKAFEGVSAHGVHGRGDSLPAR